MDIKSKNNNKYRNKYIYIINIVAIIILVMVSICTLYQYPKMKNALRLEDKQVYSNYISQSDVIMRYNTILYKEYMMSKNPDIQDESDIFIESYTTDEGYNEVIKKDINGLLNSWQKDLSKNYKNFDYAVLNEDYTIFKTNADEKIKNIIESERFDDLNETYEWYSVMEYNDRGLETISKTPSTDEFYGRYVYSGYRYSNGNKLDIYLTNYYDYRNSVNPELNNHNNGEVVQDESSYTYQNVTLKPINNIKFFYGIKKDLEHSDAISDFINDDSNRYNSGADIVVGIIGIVVLITIIVSLIVPYKLAKNTFMGNVFFKIPLEINLFIGSVGSFLIVSIFTLSVFATITGRLHEFLLSFKLEESFVEILVIVANIVFLMLFYGFILAGITYIKHIFKKGIIKSLKEDTLLGRFIRWSKVKIEKLIKYLSNIDLTDKSDKIVFKIVAINFVILSGISVIWFLGIGASLIYSVVIFVLLRRYTSEIKAKYQILLRETNEIAKGNLDVQIDEDLGLFNPFKRELIKIQVGFKKAVQKEVQSERMKSELISNVSHDLKTPLTSIITYTDLLKYGKPTEEERLQYINTIEKKSRRLKLLIEDLFEMSKANSGDIRLNVAPVDIVGLIRQTEVELEDRIEESKLTLRNIFPKDKIILNLDGEKTYRIFENLLSNASKYSIPNSRVYIEVKELEDNIEISIKNTSVVEMNFSEEEIIERFVRGDKSRNTEGSGIGLAIAKSFTEIQKGSFKIEIDGDLFKVRITFPKLKN